MCGKFLAVVCCQRFDGMGQRFEAAAYDGMGRFGGRPGKSSQPGQPRAAPDQTKGGTVATPTMEAIRLPVANAIAALTSKGR